MGLTEKSMLERWEMAKIEARLDKANQLTSEVQNDKEYNQTS